MKRALSACLIVLAGLVALAPSPNPPLPPASTNQMANPNNKNVAVTPFTFWWALSHSTNFTGSVTNLTAGRAIDITGSTVSAPTAVTNTQDNVQLSGIGLTNQQVYNATNIVVLTNGLTFDLRESSWTNGSGVITQETRGLEFRGKHATGRILINPYPRLLINTRIDLDGQTEASTASFAGNNGMLNIGMDVPHGLNILTPFGEASLPIALYLKYTSDYESNSVFSAGESPFNVNGRGTLTLRNYRANPGDSASQYYGPQLELSDSQVYVEGNPARTTNRFGIASRGGYLNIGPLQRRFENGVASITNYQPLPAIVISTNGSVIVSNAVFAGDSSGTGLRHLDYRTNWSTEAQTAIAGDMATTANSVFSARILNPETYLGTFIGDGSGLTNLVLTQPTNSAVSEQEITWNFSRLPNLTPAQTFSLLRASGFHPAASTAGNLLTVSNLTSITNIPGINGSGIFTQLTNSSGTTPALYITYSNRAGGQFIQSVRVKGQWITNESNTGTFGYMRFLNLASKTNVMMAVGDVFNNDNQNFHFNLLRNGVQLNIYTNGLTGTYTAEDGLGRVWVQTAKATNEGGGLGLGASHAYYAGSGNGVLWTCGFDILSVNSLRVFAGPNEYIRTVNGLADWQPMRAFWVETIANDAANCSASFLIQEITVSFHREAVLPHSSIFYETNNALPSQSGSFVGNRVSAGGVISQATNAISSWPAQADYPGGWALVNSNGTPFFLRASPGSKTWFSTNLAYNLDQSDVIDSFLPLKTNSLAGAPFWTNTLGFTVHLDGLLQGSGTSGQPWTGYVSKGGTNTPGEKWPGDILWGIGGTSDLGVSFGFSMTLTNGGWVGITNETGMNGGLHFEVTRR